MDTPESAEKASLRRAAEVIGGQAALAALLGYADRRNVSPWFLTDRRFPAEHCPAVEAETRRVAAEKGDPAMVVTCEQLRSDVAWAVLREQALPTKAEAVAE